MNRTHHPRVPVAELEEIAVMARLGRSAREIAEAMPGRRQKASVIRLCAAHDISLLASAGAPLGNRNNPNGRKGKGQ